MKGRIERERERRGNVRERGRRNDQKEIGKKIGEAKGKRKKEGRE